MNDPTPQDHSRAIRDRLPEPNRIMAPVRWYGGKGNMAKKIVPLIPHSKIYVEPYCGAASIFWHLTPRKVEVLNDLHSELITLYRVLQDADKFQALAHRLAWTSYALDEFRDALANEGRELDDVDRAWSFFVRQNQGFAGKATSEGDWGRSFIAKRGMADPVSSWRGRLKCLDRWHDRLGRVQIDHRDALDCIRYWDSPDTTFYLDPPYAAETRAKGKRNVYDHECSDDHHAQLVELLLTIQGNAVLSGYDTPIYQPLDGAGWDRREFRTACYAAGRQRGGKIRGEGAATAQVPRTEVVWIKPNGAERRLF